MVVAIAIVANTPKTIVPRVHDCDHKLLIAMVNEVIDDDVEAIVEFRQFQALED